MFSLLLALSLLAWEAAAGLTDRAAPAALGDFTTLFQLAQQDHWENDVNLTSMSCEDLRNKTWTHLQLNNNSLQAFPACLPGGLEALDLGANQLTVLSGVEIANFPKLRALSLRHNCLQEVAWGTGALSSLQFLDLSANKLSSLPSCQTAHLQNLKWLSLAGNPISELQPLAFSCYPQLQFLNLSATLLGRENGGGISALAFAMNVLKGDTGHRARSTIDVLDLSGTFLEKIQQEWAQDLVSLRSLHLARMAQLRSFDADLFKSLPKLRELNCQDSRALSGVRTELFDDAPHLTFLTFQNCNLSSFNPWNINSSGSINLYGNPLECNCGLSWLLSDPERVVLQRASDTICNTVPGDGEMPSSSSSLSLLQLYDECQAQRNTTFPTSNTPPLTEYSSNLPIIDSTTVAATMDSTPFAEKLYSDSFVPRNMVSMTQTAQMKNNPTSTGVFTKSTTDPTTEGTAATSSTILGELYSDSLTQQSTASTVKNATTITALFHQEETFYPSTNNPSTEATGPIGTNSPLFPGTVSPSQTDQLPQNPTKANPIPNPTHAVIQVDYVDDYYDDDQAKEKTTQPIIVSCDYDPCHHLQKPCSELQILSPCLCPGVSGEDTVPDSPRLREVSETTDTSALIHWCAPNSVVDTYQLAYHAKGSEKSQILVGEIYPTARQHTLYKLSPDTTYWVCVIASNKAGSSQTTSEILGSPCTQFTTKPSYKSIFAVLSLASGVFLITTIVLSVCLYQKCKKPHAEQYGTHLISYKNPAFDYPLKLQPCN
ncbi:leucine rich repeat neuronal 4 [Chelydra serpentina]|uniref:Leucine rich repeat neuronal 4 n=1 Tax=Chelydra serpentina TaxID=8475 RepID=A0A8T1T5R4_CHESE|nr:leucine rich repeat neuronal 4 [Chelydra serpentina]